MKNKSVVLGSIPELTDRSRQDIKYSTEMLTWFLMPIGIWPFAAHTNIIIKFFTELLVLICYLLICFLIIPCALHTFINEKDLRLKMKMIGPLSFCLMAITKYCFLVTRRKKILTCLEHVSVDWRRVSHLKDREIMLKNAKFGRFIASFCAAFMYGGGFFYHTIMPITAGSFTTPDNITIRPLTYPVYNPLFAAQTSPAYEIVFIIQWFSGFVMYTITIGACGLAAILVFHVCGQLKIVRSRLDSFVDNQQSNNNNSLENKMAEIIELHLRALG